MQDQVPKYLTLVQKSDAMYDERICSKLKNDVKPSDRINQFTLTTKSNKTIDYSNKYGLMVYCSENDIGFKDVDDLNAEFTTGVMVEKYVGLKLQETPFIIVFSPNQLLIAVVTNAKILIFQTQTIRQKKQPIHTVTLVQPVIDINWVNNDGIVYWKYLSLAYHYSFQSSLSTSFPDIKCCSAQFINNHFILTEQFNVRVFNTQHTLTHSVTYPDDTYKSEDFYGINMQDIISIIKLNNLQSSQFKANDMYAFVTVFCSIAEEDDDDTMLPNKYLFFAQGDIRTENVEFRGGQLLYHNTNLPQQYMEKVDGKDVKRGFSVKHYLDEKSKLFVVSIDRSEQIYAVDASVSFEGLKLIDFPGKYEFRFDGFVVGFAVLRNLLDFEKKYEGDNQDLKVIVQKFEGKFINIGLKDNDKDIYVIFPFSVISWNHKGVQNKQYLVKTDPEIDTEDKEEVKYSKMRQLLPLSSIIEPSSLRSSEPDIKKETNVDIKTEVKVEPKAQNNVEPKIQNKDQSQTKKEPLVSLNQKQPSKPQSEIAGKLPQPFNLGLANTNSSSLPSLFGNKQNANLTNPLAPTIPINPPINLPSFGALFKPSSLNPFDQPKANSNNIFESNKTQTKPVENKLSFDINKDKIIQKKQDKNQIPKGDFKPVVNPTTSLFADIPKQTNSTITNTTSDKVTPQPSLFPKLKQALVQKLVQKQKVEQKKEIIEEKQKEEQKKILKEESPQPQLKIQSDVDRVIKAINLHTNQFNKFLDYITQIEEQKRQSLPSEPQQRLQQEMIEFLNQIKKQHYTADMASIQIDHLNNINRQLKAKSKNQNRLQLNYRSSEVMNSLEDIIRTKLDEYNNMSEKIMYLKRRLSSSQSISILKITSPISKSAEITKIVNQQTKKIKSLEEKVNASFEQYKKLKISMNDNLTYNKFDENLKLEFFEEESDEEMLSFEDVLMCHQSRVVEVDANVTAPSIMDLGWLRGKEREEQRKKEMIQKERIRLERIRENEKLERIQKAEALKQRQRQIQKQKIELKQKQKQRQKQKQKPKVQIPSQQQSRVKKFSLKFNQQFENSEEQKEESDGNDSDLLVKLPGMTQQISSLVPDFNSQQKLGLDTKKQQKGKSLENPLLNIGKMENSTLFDNNNSKPVEKEKQQKKDTQPQSKLFDPKQLEPLLNKNLFAGLVKQVTNQFPVINRLIGIGKDVQGAESLLSQNNKKNDEEGEKKQTQPKLPSLFPSLVSPKIGEVPKSKQSQFLPMSDIHTGLIKQQEKQKAAQPKVEKQPQATVKAPMNLFPDKVQKTDLTQNKPSLLNPGTKPATNLFPTIIENKTDTQVKPPISLFPPTAPTQSKGNATLSEKSNPLSAKPINLIPNPLNSNVNNPQQNDNSSKPLLLPTTTPPNAAGTTNLFSNNPPSTSNANTSIFQTSTTNAMTAQIKAQNTSGPSFGTPSFGSSSFGTSGFGSKPQQPQQPVQQAQQQPQTAAPVNPNTGMFGLNQGQFKGFGTVDQTNKQSTSNIFTQNAQQSNNMNQNNNFNNNSNFNTNSTNTNPTIFPNPNNFNNNSNNNMNMNTGNNNFMNGNQNISFNPANNQQQQSNNPWNNSGNNNFPNPNQPSSNFLGGQMQGNQGGQNSQFSSNPQASFSGFNQPQQQSQPNFGGFGNNNNSNNMGFNNNTSSNNNIFNNVNNQNPNQNQTKSLYGARK